jgi:hypothetical protein
LQIERGTRPWLEACCSDVRYDVEGEVRSDELQRVLQDGGVADEHGAAAGGQVVLGQCLGCYLGSDASGVAHRDGDDRSLGHD